MKFKKDCTDEELFFVYRYLICILNKTVEDDISFGYSQVNKNVYMIAENLSRKDVMAKTAFYKEYIANLEEVGKYFIVMAREDPFKTELIISLKEDLDLENLYIAAKLTQ